MGLRGPGAKPKLHIARGKNETSPGWNNPSLSRAERVIAFLESLTITSGILAGQKFKVEDWQRPIIERWYNGTTRTGILSVARKNGKTGLVTGLALCHLLGPEVEPRGQIVVGAADRDQSGIVFDELEAYIEDNPQFSAECNIKRHEKVIEHLPSRSKFKALSSDAKKAHGLSPSVVILDELAQWGSGLGRRLYDALTTAGGARKSPLKFIIGTQAEDDHHIMSRMIDLGMSGNDDKIAAFIFEIPKETDVFDEVNWKLANPALGTFRDLEDLRGIAREARFIPSSESSFRNLNCNQRITSVTRWIPKALWDACQRKTPITDDDLLAAGPCYGGLDLSSVNDLTAFALFWPDPGFLKVWAWCPEENLRRRCERDHVPYDEWAARGLIEPTPGEAIDMHIVGERICDLWLKYQPQMIAFDEWGITSLKKVLSEDGRPELLFTPFGQGYRSMSPATKAFEQRVLNRQIIHDGNELLAWSVKNVHIETDAAENKKPSKWRSHERIDPVVAAVMGVGLAATMEAKSEYQLLFVG